MKLINQVHDDYGNKKIVLELADGAMIEAAIFRHHDRIHFCIPSQVGCLVGCRHCATTYTVPSFIRQLSVKELEDIIEFLRNYLLKGEYPDTLSFSGHGEPMCNWGNIVETVQSKGYYFNDIHITSVGVPEIMNNILGQNFRPAIYFSLHSADDLQRRKVIGCSRKIRIASINEIKKFSEKYVDSGGRIVWNYMTYKENITIMTQQKLLELLNSCEFALEIRLTNYVDIRRKNGIQGLEMDEIAHFYNALKKKISNNIQIRISNLEGIELTMACGQLKASIS